MTKSHRIAQVAQVNPFACAEKPTPEPAMMEAMKKVAILTALKVSGQKIATAQINPMPIKNALIACGNSNMSKLPLVEIGWLLSHSGTENRRLHKSIHGMSIAELPRFLKPRVSKEALMRETRNTQFRRRISAQKVQRQFGDFSEG